MKRSMSLCIILLIAVVSYIYVVTPTMSYFFDTDKSIAATVAYNVRFKPSIALSAVENDTKIYGSLIKGDSTVGGTLKKSYIFPGKQLISLQNVDPTPKRIPLTVENLSDTPSNLRIRITTTVSAREGDSADYIQAWKPHDANNDTQNKWFFGKKKISTQIFAPFMEVNFACPENKSYKIVKITSPGNVPWEEWELQVLKGGSYTPDLPAVSVSNGVGERFPLISSVSITIESIIEGSTPYFASLFADRKLEFTVEYFAKQSEGMDWQPIYSNSVSFGR